MDNTNEAENTVNTDSENSPVSAGSVSDTGKIKITTPMTIVGMFLVIGEAAFTTLALVSEELQSTFVWFAMGYPVLLVILFFLTWNFNSKVLNPDNIEDINANIKTITDSYSSKFEKKIDELEKLIERTKKDIAKEAASKSVGQDSGELIKLVDSKMKNVYSKLSEAKSTTANFVKLTSNLPGKKAQMSILSALSNGEPMSAKQISAKTGLKEQSIVKGINDESLKSILTKEDGAVTLYRANLF